MKINKLTNNFLSNFKKIRKLKMSKRDKKLIS